MTASAQAYARRLLRDLGLDAEGPLDVASEHPASGWATSGLMALTGEADGSPQMCPIPLTTCADGALAALASLAPASAFAGLRGSQLLAERAAIAGYSRQGPVSPGGSCRLMQAADGWIAVNLARPDDWALVAAWLGRELAPEWKAVADELRAHVLHDLLERGRELGLAVAAAAPSLTTNAARRSSPLPPRGGGEGERGPAPTSAPSPPALRARHGARRWVRERAQGRPLPPPRFATPCRDRPPQGGRGDKPRVLDLSSLWAGPLCSHLLQFAGADVIKVESLQRPDGARSGPPAFFDLFNAGKRSVALDFASEQGRAQLRGLIANADIVIEASRPRALRQLGIVAEELVRENPRLTWLSITGYGRGEPQENWIAYGDDAAVAAGLSGVMFEATGRHLICGDAIADPLTGLHAALAAWAAYKRGGGGLVSLSLTGVVRQCLDFDLPGDGEVVRKRQHDWSALVTEVAAPRARASAGRARAPGADTQAVLAEWRA